MHRSFTPLLLIALAITALALPGSAAAAEVYVSYGVLRYVAQPGEANVVTVTRDGDALVITESGPGVDVTSSEGCTVAGTTARCVLPSHADFSLGDGGSRADVSAAAGPWSTAVRGGEGPDVLVGGPGEDMVIGNGGADRLHGGDGRDTLFGNDGDDELHGDGGDDSLDGQAGADHLLGGAGRDALTAGPARDFFGSLVTYADRERNVLDGGTDGDVLFGASGPDVLGGGDGDDSLYGGAGPDALDGGIGDDLLQGAHAGAFPDPPEDDAAPDALVCGDGVDRTGPGAGDAVAPDCEHLGGDQVCPQTQTAGCEATIAVEVLQKAKASRRARSATRARRRWRRIGRTTVPMATSTRAMVASPVRARLLAALRRRRTLPARTSVVVRSADGRALERMTQAYTVTRAVLSGSSK